MVWDTYLTPYVVSNNACLCLSINANIKQLNKGDFMSVASLKCDKVSNTHNELITGLDRNPRHKAFWIFSFHPVFAGLDPEKKKQISR